MSGRQPLERKIIAISLLCATLSVFFHYVTSVYAVWNVIKVVSASLTILIVPGVLLLLIARLKTQLTILEIGCIGAALSVGIITLLTIVCMLTHTAFSLIVMPLVICLFFIGLIAVRQNTEVGLTIVSAPASELWLILGMIVIAILLYPLGSPLFQGEDQIHIAVARRLAILPNPSVYNIYLTPNIVYTYPFPVTHAIVTLTSIMAGIDVLFVYHKLRFIWAILAILCVYVATKKIFDNSLVACISGWTCIVFVASGVYGEVPPLMWAQLAPFSHASDVAMGVLLPLLLVSSFYYLSSECRRDSIIFLIIALLMSLTLTTAKIREIIQFMVYSASFLAVVLFTKQQRSLLFKIAILGGATLIIVGLYVMYHRFTVASVTSIVEVNRAYILELWKNMSLLDYIARPLNDGRIVNNFQLLFINLNALVLLGSPLVFLAFFRQRLLLFVWASLVAYLLIIRFPILSIPYLLLTYFDMLSSPVRNVIFFIYIMTGVMVYMTAFLFSKLKPLALAMILLLGLAFILSETAEKFRGVLMAQPDWLFLPLLIALPLALGFGYTRWGKSFSNLWLGSESSSRFVVCAAVLIMSLGFFLYKPDSALTIWKKPVITNFEQTIESSAAHLMPIEYTAPNSAKIYSAKGTSDVPTNDLIQWMKKNVPVKAICAVNMFNSNVLTAYIPQQVPAWPLAFYDPINYRINFPEFCESADHAFEKFGSQPFFNDNEQREERIKFLGKFDISYVVIDPSYYDVMGRVLGQHPDLFIKVYDQSHWRVYRVKRSVV